jgi:hypothetical protein
METIRIGAVLFAFGLAVGGATAMIALHPSICRQFSKRT